MKKLSLIVSCAFIFLQPDLCLAQERIDLNMVGRIKEAGFHHSQVMNTLFFLSDVYGPRLSGTPDYRKSAEWAKRQLEDWGLDDVTLERYESVFAGWAVESFSIAMIEPRFSSITGLPAAWTGSTPGQIGGVPVLIDFHDLDSLKQYSGKLKDKILLFPESKPRNPPSPRVYGDEILQQANSQINTSGSIGLGDNREYDLKEMMREEAESFGKKDLDRIMAFLIENEVAAVLEPSCLDNGVLSISEARFGNNKNGKAVPYIFISKEDHGRLRRMMERGVQPVIQIDQKTEFYSDPDYHVNVIGEITGHDIDLKDQIVFIGAHLDSWHGGTGASDNAVGVAIMMEVMRIFKQLDIKPRRTIKIGLWGGEEQMFDGSIGYVKNHIGDPFGDGEPKKELSQISAYFNHDTGDGKIRGVYLQGNETLRPLFVECFKPFNYLGVETVSSRNSFGTDHVIFDAVNIPAFEFIQDPSMNESYQWHTNMDISGLITEENLKLNAVVIATIVYHVAMRDEMLRRKFQID